MQIIEGDFLRILLTNDDGIYAEGIRILAEVLRDNGHQVFITAPDRERSAAGHSITILEPLRANRIDHYKNIEAYQINGTPADCVKLGIEKLMSFSPELIISGINNGSNLGYDVLYSGTVSAAIEGWIMGFNSIAVSLVCKGKRKYITAANYINNYISDFDLSVFKETILLNINVPDCEFNQVKGVRITKLGTSLYEDTYEERTDPMGKKYYWISGGNGRDEKGENTDIVAVENDFISITPLKIDLNNENLIENWPGKK